MKWLPRLAVVIGGLALSLCYNPSSWADDDEDFLVQEDSEFFEHARTGLMYKRTLYDNGEDVTFVPNYPTSYNSTNDSRSWKVYISHWEQDPPSFVTLFVMDDTPNLYRKNEIDLEISINHFDHNKNMVEASKKQFVGIELVKGINRIPLNIHNYKGDVVSVKMRGQRPKQSIGAFEVTGE